jgi:hypothetical protein
VGKTLAAGVSVNRPAAVDPVDGPAQDSQQAGLSESVVKPPTKPAPAAESPGLLTPLAAVWPTATPPKPRPPEQAAGEKAPTKQAAQTVKVTFVLLDLGAKQVSLSGDFNGWSPNAMPMRRDSSGHWETTVALAPGRHQYKFVADGEWIPDPLARENVWNQHGTLNSVVEVRP